MIMILLAEYWFLLVILLGYLLKRAKLFSQEDGISLLKFIFLTTLPALILSAIPAVRFTREFIFAPFIMAFFIFGVFLVAYPIIKARRLPRKTEGALLLSCIIMNTGFFYPFVEAFHGAEGIALMAFFDVMNAIIMFSFIYFIATTYGEGTGGIGVVKKLLFSPPLLALIAGFGLLWLNLAFPPSIMSVLQLIGGTNTPLLMLAVGLLLEFRIVNKTHLLHTLFLRMVFGFALGLIAVEILGLTGLMKTLTLMLSVAPSGFNTVVFSAMEDLDTEYAASVLSITLLLSIILTPLILSYL